MNDHYPDQMSESTEVAVPQEEPAEITVTGLEIVEWDLYPSGVVDVCPMCGSDARPQASYHEMLRLSAPCGQLYFGAPGWQTFPDHVCKVCQDCAGGWVETVKHRA